ncbi:MAG: hypothetical protein K6C05_04465 [Anaerovibrio sp.]|uniref:hypothetical protein n=1 Tax=Anaerovibrio sp. TaxID=1872532 RepID=UPI0025FD53E6|nr:hypothetical protein [Anaerovibrio sp.]MCR5176083.1 hypothetical protein [Anaerovibrio sp.]
MKKVIILFMACMLLFTSSSFADNSSNDDSSDSTVTKSDEQKEARFIKIHEDESFVYLLDKKDSGWIRRPYSAGEYIIDAWIKMIPYSYSASVNYNSSEIYDKYYLEHYLIDPANKKIQFLCELEVSGRPDNNIRQRPYYVGNWEGLVPGSVEDSIYHSVVKIMGTKKGSSGIKGKLGDFIEDVFRISI